MDLTKLILSEFVISQRIVRKGIEVVPRLGGLGRITFQMSSMIVREAM